LDKTARAHVGAIFKVFTDTASSTEVPIYDKKTDVENIAIPNAPRTERSGTALGSLIGYFMSQRKIAHDSSSGKAATSVLQPNTVCATGG